MSQTQVVSIGITVVALGGLARFFRTRIGIAMRAAAFDQEAAMAQGISVGKVFALAWAIGGGTRRTGRGLRRHGAPGGRGHALHRLRGVPLVPGIVVGGLDSMPGAVVGGMLVGMAEVFVGGLSVERHLAGRRLLRLRPVAADDRGAALQALRHLRYRGDQAGMRGRPRPTLHPVLHQRCASLLPSRRSGDAAHHDAAGLSLLVLVAAVLLPLRGLPVVDFLGDSAWLVIVNRALVFIVGALGLNLLTGVAGQVSLGHAFFMAVGAYTAAVVGGEPGSASGVSGCRCGCGFPPPASSPHSSASWSLPPPSGCAGCISHS